MDSLNGLELELKLILKAMVDQKGFLVLPEAVNFVVDVLLTFAQDSFACAENVQDILAGGGRSLREENERQLLEKILGENPRGATDVLSMTCMLVSLVTCTMESTY